VKAVKKQSAGA